MAKEAGREVGGGEGVLEDGNNAVIVGPVRSLMLPGNYQAAPNLESASAAAAVVVIIKPSTAAVQGPLYSLTSPGRGKI